MTALIRQIQPVWAQLQQLESPVPAHALRTALLALAAGVLAMAGLAAASTFWGPTQAWWLAVDGGSALVAGVQASLLAAVATAVGALPVFVVQRIGKRQEAAFMAFSAGVMLAAAVFSLLLPSLEASRALVGGGGAAALFSGLGLALGMALMFGIDRALPHEHAVLPPAAPGHAVAARPGDRAAQRAWLMVLALMIHNLPEGLAVGVAYAGPASADAVHGGAAVALAIGLQNMPEGLIVAMALRTLGLGAGKAWGVAALTGLAEPLGAMLGIAVLGSLPALYPLGLALAAGAMIFVVSHEIIPETHRNGFEGAASATLLAGFVFMIWLNEALA
ncbi:MAG: ZIP family metal transporter [Hydrogenophaga sp.]|uniref:ZIP family metal transporter n=1 Tax=Hydrogenophaga sp. TaxID=1904254 RepID=UPI00257A6832|nr:ZIP family metal transporter [Hydrogenophaga sp.]MBL0942948.1 ZIP family metal transporter [Hydrogenophaga sp.]